MKYKDFLLNIQLFAEAPDAGAGSGGADPTPSGTEGQAGAPTGTEGTTIEVPEYINQYVSGLTDERQREYLAGLMQDENAVNLLKGLIPDPNAEYTIKPDEYNEIGDDVNAYLTAAKEQGIPETVVRHQLEARKNYLASEKAKMTPEQIALEPVINNFIGAEKDAEIQGVYARLAENAAGRRVLEKIIKSANPASPSIQGGGAVGGTTYTEAEFVEAYNEAKPYNGEPNKQALKALENFARNNENPFFRDFMGLNRRG